MPDPATMTDEELLAEWQHWPKHPSGVLTPREGALYDEIEKRGLEIDWPPEGWPYI